MTKKLTDLDISNIGFDPQETEDLDQELADLQEPFDPKLVDIQVVQTTMDNLIKRLQHDEIDLNPDFQRTAGLWRTEIKGRLIESLLIKLPLPAFYFDASDDEKWQVVDGLQRLITIRQFVIDKSLRLKGLEYLKDYAGSIYDELPRTFLRRIDEAPVTLYLIKPGTPKNVKYSLFYRINTGGLALNAQEIRHALSQSTNNAQASKYLKKLAKSDYFQQCVRVPDKRMLDKELILRYIAFKLHDYKSYKEPMIKFLNDAMEDLGELTKEELFYIEKDFQKAITLSWYIFEENAFRKSILETRSRRVINRALFEVIAVALSNLKETEVKNLKKNKKRFLNDYKNLLENNEFDNRISISTTYSDNVKYRFEKINTLIKKYC